MREKNNYNNTNYTNNVNEIRKRVRICARKRLFEYRRFWFVSYRALEDRELEKRIKIHMEKLQDHRTKSYGSIQDELASARRNLEMASDSI